MVCCGRPTWSSHAGLSENISRSDADPGCFHDWVSLWPVNFGPAMLVYRTWFMGYENRELLIFPCLWASEYDTLPFFRASV